MVISKMTKRWTQGERLTGNFLISTGFYYGEPVLFITWPQRYADVVTYITKDDLSPDDPVNELFNVGADPDWENQDEYDVGISWDGQKPYMYSDKYRLN